MSVPLATLRRHGQLVWLHDPMGLPEPAPLAKPGAPYSAVSSLDVTLGQRRDFWQPEGAEDYLRFWKSDESALMALRSALQKSEPSAPVFSWNDDQVIAKLGARLARGDVVLIEAAHPPVHAVLPAAPAPPAVVNPPAVPVSQILAGVKPPPPPLLPILEEVQIEGAEVLPEIEQSLEMVEVTIGEIKLAPVSLAPTPSKVPGIETAMTEAGASVTSTLDKL